jgi:hypothetical protein
MSWARYLLQNVRDEGFGIRARGLRITRKIPEVTLAERAMCTLLRENPW